jgi:hypothetical protein
MRQFNLDDEQIKMLISIYDKRKRLFYQVMLSFPALFLVGLFQIQRIFRKLPSGGYEFGLGGAIYIIFCLLVFGTMVLLFILKLRPVTKDLKDRLGVYIDRVVISKSHFQHVGTYFLFFDDAKLPNKEVSRVEFEKFSVGDVYSVPMSKHSKIVLDGFMNYDL